MAALLPLRGEGTRHGRQGDWELGSDVQCALHFTTCKRKRKHMRPEQRKAHDAISRGDGPSVERPPASEVH